MSIRLYNTLTRSVDPLPEPPGPVRMYICGSTVYQRIHVGNARPFVLGMWLRNWLRESGYDVTLVHNITDVDDKVYAQAAKQGIPSRELSGRATEWFFEDTDDLGLGRPDVEPRATETISEIVDFIQELIDGGHAYTANGDVYFSVADFPEYGRLSGAKLEEMVTQEESDLKRDQRDFALWKAQKPHEDAAWDSPWGRGRPGWHIECSVMAEKYLGPVFELHGGGNDLRFPHHENEYAQSRALGHEFARIWTHNGMLEFTGEKMAKSVGNVVTLRDAIDEWGRETILLLFLGAHWRKPMDFSSEKLGQARTQWHRLSRVSIEGSGRLRPGPHRSWDDFARVLDDDFNTPEALAILHEWHATGDADLLRKGLGIFGLHLRGQRVTIQPAIETDVAMPIRAIGGLQIPRELSNLADRRLQARREREFKLSDSLRVEIQTRGWEVEDVEDGYRLSRRLPVVEYLGNRPPSNIWTLAARRYEARARWDTNEEAELDKELAVAGYRVEDLPDKYVIVPVHRRR